MAQKHARIESLGIEQYLEPPFEAFRDLSAGGFSSARCWWNALVPGAVFCGNQFSPSVPERPAMWSGCALSADPLGISLQIVPMAQYGSQAVFLHPHPRGAGGGASG